MRISTTFVHIFIVKYIQYIYIYNILICICVTHTTAAAAVQNYLCKRIKLLVKSFQFYFVSGVKYLYVIQSYRTLTFAVLCTLVDGNCIRYNLAQNFQAISVIDQSVHVSHRENTSYAQSDSPGKIRLMYRTITKHALT